MADKTDAKLAGSLSLNKKPLVIEIGAPVSSIDYRRPKKELAAWDFVSSAPAIKTKFAEDDLTIQVTDLSRLTIVDGTGKELILPQSVALDVTPVEKAYISSGGSSPLSLGELKRAKNPHRLRRSSDDSDSDDTRRALNLCSARRAVSICPEYLTKNAGSRYNRVVREKHAVALMQGDPAIDKIGGVEAESPHRATKVDTEAKERFEQLLGRLKPSASGSRSSITNDQGHVSALLARDPAIIAARSKKSNRASKADHAGAAGSIHRREPGSQCTNATKTSASDSGYTSFGHAQKEKLDGKTFIHAKHDSGFDSDSSLKKLNPMAAEFDAGAKKSAPQLQSSNAVVGDSKSAQEPKVAPAFFGTDNFGQYGPLPFFGPIPEPSPPFSNGSPMAGPGFFGPFIPPGLGPMMPPMPPMPPMANFHGNVTPPMAFSNFGPFTPGPMSPMPMPPMMPNNQSPPPMFDPAPFNPGPMPMMPPSSCYSVPPSFPVAGPRRPVMPMPPVSAPIAPARPQGPAMPHPPPAAGRAHFPVTKKPRDHDPIKQQQYEAYLEYRKMNEPGYHLACRARQANRIAREKQRVNVA